jgi:hypothetical protein
MGSADPISDHAAPLPPAKSGISGWDLIVGSLAVLLWLTVGWMVAISIPRGARLFAEFHMIVPLYTQMLIRFGQWAIPVLALVTLLMCLKVRKRWAWLWLLIVLPAFLICAVFLGLYFPITSLLNGLGGSNDGWWDYFW